MSTATSSPVPKVLLAVAAAVVLAGAGYLALGADDAPASDGSAIALEHVHGLGVDPADGRLYAGSHYGLFGFPEGDGQSPVADRVQDFMGFTVVGPSHFLASGHPGEGQGGPTALGLIESTDAGRTWTSRSLEGEADFHALEYRHETVYGANASTGDFMISKDMTTWETRSTLPMADFTVSPTDEDLVVATTQDGPVRSNDGGSTFEPIEDAPLLLLVNYTDDGTLVASDVEGAIYLSTDDADTWERAGTLVAAPEALYAASATEIYAAVSGGLYASDDAGRSFDPVPSD